MVSQRCKLDIAWFLRMAVQALFVQVGEPLEVPPRRSKGEDLLLPGIESQLQAMLDKLSRESRLFEPSADAERGTPPSIS